MTWRVVLSLLVVPPVWRRSRWLAVAACVGLWAPLPAAVVAAAAGLERWLRSRRARRRREERAEAEVALLGDLVVLGLSGGLGLTEALATAAAELDSVLAAEVGRVVRRLRRGGAAAVLDAEGARAGRLYVTAGRAMATGAPVLAAVDRFVADVRGEEARRRRAAARRLPVLMMFPLALLILPGFMLLLVAPALVSALGRLGS